MAKTANETIQFNYERFTRQGDIMLAAGVTMLWTAFS